MKYFDINTLARPRPTVGIRLRTPRARHHDIQKPWLHDSVTINGVRFTFKSTPMAQGSVLGGKRMEWPPEWNTPLVSPVQPLTLTNKNVHQIMNQMIEKLKKSSNRPYTIHYENK